MIPTEKSNRSVCELFRLMEFSDSALPVGGFSFSCGVETATACGMIHDEESPLQLTAPFSVRTGRPLRPLTIGLGSSRREMKIAV